MQICIEFFALNANIKLALFSLPSIADLMGKLGKAKYFNSINLATAYCWVKIAQGDTHKNVYFTNKGLYEYFKLLFELWNAPKTSQRLLNLMFVDFIN